MIQNYAPAEASDEARIVIRPNRSLTAQQLRWVVAVFALVTVTISLLSWLQGNAFAPLFALIEIGLFAACLGFVWARCGRAEVIVVNPTQLCVRRLPELTDVFQAHPAWVHVDSSDGRLVLYSAGKGLEVGQALTLGERRELGRLLREVLQSAALSPRRQRGKVSNDDVVE